MHLEHVNLTVVDLDRSIDFYCRLFGFSVRWRGAGKDGKPAAHIGSKRFYLALFQATDRTVELQKSYDRVGLNHVGFVVDDIDAMKARLEELGTPCKSEQVYDPGHHVYFFDPSGIEVELTQYATGESPIPGTDDGDSIASNDAPSVARPAPISRMMSSVRLGFDTYSPQLPWGGLSLPR